MSALGECAAGLTEQAGVLAQASCGFGNSFGSAVLLDRSVVTFSPFSTGRFQVERACPRSLPQQGEGWGRGQQLAEVSSLLLQALLPSLQRKKPRLETVYCDTL